MISTSRSAMARAASRRALVCTAAVLLAGIATPIAAQDDAGGQGNTPSGAARTASSPSDDQYDFGVGDVVQVQVWGRSDLSSLVPVDPAGRIQVPLLGAIAVEGRTPAQLTEELTQRYQLLEPSVEEVLVSVAQYNSRTLTLVGQVARPGTYGFRELPDLWEAMLVAGGATGEAALSRVQIVRRQRTAEEPRTFRVDLSQGMQRTAAETLPELRPQDTIIVPAIDTLSPEGDAFRMFGEVGSPGAYSLTLATNVLDALAVAGGASADADLRTVRLLRETPTGLMAYELDVEGLLYRADPTVALDLRPGDTITVPREQTFVSRITEALAPFVTIAGIVVLVNRGSR